MRRALQLIAHGSRHSEANADLNFFADELRRRGEYDVVVASFLELAEPSIEQAAALCVEQGAERVILLPFFLSSGVHVQRDLVETRDKLAARYPHFDFRLAEPLGRHPLLVQIVIERANAVES